MTGRVDAWKYKQINDTCLQCCVFPFSQSQIKESLVRQTLPSQLQTIASVLRAGSEAILVLLTRSLALGIREEWGEDFLAMLEINPRVPMANLLITYFRLK